MRVGQIGTASTVVAQNNTAKAVKSGSLNVFATPMLVALMEEAACNALAVSLEAGQTTVGTAISINHSAASPLGAKITARAEITAVNKREITFNVTAKDEKNEIGAGTHTRFMVDEARFLARVEAP